MKGSTHPPSYRPHSSQICAGGLIGFVALALACTKAENNEATPGEPTVFEFICEPREVSDNRLVRSGCVDPIAVPDRAGKDSGFVCCADGSINRAEKRVLGSFSDDECSEDADCNAEDGCYPGTILGKNVPNSCMSILNCVVDADCASGECGAIDALGPTCPLFRWTLCRTDSDQCRTNQDCGDGEYCALWREYPDGENESEGDFRWIWKCDEFDECLER